MERVRKLMRMSRQELAWRLTAAVRVERDRAWSRLRSRAWNRRRLRRMLSHDVLDPVLVTHIERGDWNAADRALVRTLKARPRLFVLDSALALELRYDIVRRWPGAPKDAAARADRVLSGRYDLLGYRGLSFRTGHGAVDWHFDPVHRRRAPLGFWSDIRYLDPSLGDHKIIWELNRHQHWLVLGRALWLTRDRRYAQAMTSQLHGWMAANPPLTGVNWASALELGFRSLSWIWGLHFLLADTVDAAATQSPWLVDLLVGLDAQLRQLERNLSYYFSPNTHLTGEALALYVCGLSLPELAGSARWTSLGRRILLDEIDRQIAADGGHAERSTHYHRYTLDFYLLALLMAERSQDSEAIARFTDAATRAAEFARTIADDSGRLPLIGDDDGGMLWPLAGRACDDVRDSLALAAILLARPDLAPWGVPEEVFWIAGRTAFEQEPFVNAHRADAEPLFSRALVDTGYVVARDGHGGHLVFDVGAHGYMNGGHAHADALSITLEVDGRPLLIDPGTSTYTANPSVRDRLRRTANHNTLTLDRRSSSLPSGPFHWASRTDAVPGAARHNLRFDWAEGWHDGYGANRHRRTVFRAPSGGWLVVDEVLGRGEHAAELHWHFDPAWIVKTEDAATIRATHFETGATSWLAHDGGSTIVVHGDDESGLGWFAPAYGTLIPTWSASVCRSGRAPLSIATWIASGGEAPAVSRLEVDCPAASTPPIAVVVRQQTLEEVTLVRPGEPEVRETRGCGTPVFHTDGRLLHYACEGGRLRTLVVCDADHVLALREGWLSVAADRPLADLCVEMVGDRIDLWASEPTSRLRLDGEVVAAASTIRANGRELPRRSLERDDAVVALASDWGAPGRTVSCAASPVSPI